MITLTYWIYAIKKLGSDKSRDDIRRVIVDECLLRPEKVHGIWQVDGNKVWNIFIESDPICKNNAEARNLHNAIGVESWLDELQYMRNRPHIKKSMHKR